MSESALDLTRQQSPLVACLGLAESDRVNGVGLSERAFLTHINVRADASDSQSLNTLSSALGIALPLKPNQCIHNDTSSAFWLGPDEWLVVATADALAADDIPAMVESLNGAHVAITDLSSGQTVIQLAGDAAADLLRRGCPFDIDQLSQSSNACVQTHINHINVLIWSATEQSDGGGFELIVRRSFADYLWRWLQQTRSHLG